MATTVDRSSVETPGALSGVRSAVPLALTFVVAWWFWDSPWLFPLRVLVVLAHEVSHALATVLTGGTVVEVGLGLDEGGHTLSSGGSAFLITSAGYLGSMLWGVLLLAATRQPGPARGLSVLLGAGVVTAGLGWVRPVASLGFGFTVFAGAVLVALGIFASHRESRWLLRFVGAFSVLYAFLDIRDDVFLSAGRSDAVILAEITGVPAIVWGVLWCAVGLLVLRVGWKRLV